MRPLLALHGLRWGPTFQLTTRAVGVPTAVLAFQPPVLPVVQQEGQGTYENMIAAIGNLRAEVEAIHGRRFAYREAVPDGPEHVVVAGDEATGVALTSLETDGGEVEAQGGGEDLAVLLYTLFLIPLTVMPSFLSSCAHTAEIASSAALSGPYGLTRSIERKLVVLLMMRPVPFFFMCGSAACVTSMWPRTLTA